MKLDERAQTETGPGRAPIRVVICDDELRTREALSGLLSARSALRNLNGAPPIVVVGHAVNGQDAIQAVADLHPDVVLIDARLPVLDGPDATRRIKERWPTVKVILLASSAGQETSAADSGADFIWLKGSPSDHLIEEIIGIS